MSLWKQKGTDIDLRERPIKYNRNGWFDIEKALSLIDLPPFTFTYQGTELHTVMVRMKLPSDRARGLFVETWDAFEVMRGFELPGWGVLTPELLYRHCLFNAISLNAHELEEQFKVAGEYWMDPHKDGDIVAMRIVHKEGDLA